jgi:hypothetical protein
MNVSDLSLRMNTTKQFQTVSIMVNLYLELLYDSFKKCPQTSSEIHSNTLSHWDLVGMRTLRIHFDGED